MSLIRFVCVFLSNTDPLFMCVMHSLIRYTMFITANAHEGDAVAALGLLKEMKNARVSASVQTFSAAMDACLRSDNPDLALALSAEMKRSGIEPDEVSDSQGPLCLKFSLTAALYFFCLSIGDLEGTVHDDRTGLRSERGGA